MNPTEQRNHTRRTDELAAAIEDVSADALYRCTHIEQTCRQLISNETTARLALAREQRSYVDNEDRLLRLKCEERLIAFVQFTSRGFWGRLNWLLTGR